MVHLSGAPKCALYILLNVWIVCTAIQDGALVRHTHVCLVHSIECLGCMHGHLGWCTCQVDPGVPCTLHYVEPLKCMHGCLGQQPCQVHPGVPCTFFF